ncbi:MAG: hypothetical protein K2N16_01560, partial [Muribaculaceae bacterium]|nr:hypothetical protein [Muribaculaceae bacterium]
MKKPLLLASATAICLLASAQTPLQPQVIAGEIVARISPNGEWISNHDVNFGVITVTNLVTGERYMYESNEEEGKLFTAGLGNCLSNNGVVLGTSDLSVSVIGYGEKGVWHNLPIRPEDIGMCSANGISADGKVICGHVGGVAFGADDGSIMVHPVVWTLQDDGTYGLYQELPYPTKDFLGQTPQYVTAVSVSGDGKTIAGQVVSNSGMYTEPVIYTQSADGNWSYTLVNNQEIFNPNNVEYPQYPNDQPEYPDIMNFATPEEIAACDAAVEEFNNYSANQPQMTDFMTEEEKAAYQDAIDNWNPEESYYPSPEEYMTSEELEAYNAAVDEFWANYPEYPSLRNFMTEEEVAKYDAAEAAYNVAMEEWYTKFEEYQNTIDEFTADVPHFIFNTVILSNNGRYLGLSNQKQSMFWGEESENATVYVFDLEAGTYSIHSDSQELDLLVCYVGDNGQVLAAGPVGNRIRNTYFCHNWNGEGGYQAIQDMVKEADPTLYAWMEENMRHPY